MKYKDDPFWKNSGVPLHHALMEKYIDIDFEIKPLDIHNGVSCPLYIALERFLGDDFKNIVVHPNAVTIGVTENGGDDWAFREFSGTLRQWIKDFDDGKMVHPITLRFTRENVYNAHPVLTIKGQ